MRALRLIAVILALLAVPATAAAGPPAVSIFYYPWYGNPAMDGGWTHWQAPGIAVPDIASNYYPARGLYSSSSKRVVAAQMHEIAAAGVREVVSSWWGWGSPEDLRLPLVIEEAHAAGLSVGIHIEPYPGRTIETVEADVDHLLTLGITRFFVYEPFDIAAGDWAALHDRLTGIQLFGQTALAGLAANAHFDGLYTYDVLLWGGATFARICSQARRVGLLCLPSVGPGYDASQATGDPRLRSRRNGATYDSMWGAAIRAGADGVTITSYNEWQEGTQIEPARRRTGRTAASAALQSYDGAYGLSGRPAERAYLDRTAYWAYAFGRSLTLTNRHP